MKCERCGREHGNLREVRTFKGYEMWCDDCIEEYARACDICGKLTEERFMRFCGEDCLCPECVKELTYECGYCNKLHYITKEDTNPNYTYVHTFDGTKMWCDDCVEKHATRCWHCEDWYENSMTYETNDGRPICPDCYSNYYFTCDDCGQIFNEDYLHCVGEGSYYCDDCYEKHNADYLLHEHDYNPEPTWYFKGDAILDERHSGFFKGLGVELEVDHGNSKLEPIQEMLEFTESDREELYFKKDGSLDNGFEIVTQPHDEDAFWRIDWQRVMDVLSEYGWESHGAMTCGLHIHVSRTWFGDSGEEQTENIYKIVAFYERCWDELMKFSRRERWQAKDWAKRFLSEGEYPTEKKVKSKADTYSRYRAVNLTNEYTVEFRLGRGTLNYKSFHAWIDFHMALARNAAGIEWEDLNDITKWLEGIDGMTIEYLASHNLFGYGESTFAIEPEPVVDLHEFANLDAFTEVSPIEWNN